MKKLKWILLFIIILLAILFLFATCKKTKALESELFNVDIEITERDQSKYFYVAIYNISDIGSSCTFNYIRISSQDQYYFTRTGETFRFYRYYQGNYSLISSFTSPSHLFQISIDYDAGDLVCIVYSLGFSYQVNQGVEPIFDGVTRTLKMRQILDGAYLNEWSNNQLIIRNPYNSGNYEFNFLMNYSYVDYSETLQDINIWVDNQIYNSYMFNYLVSIGYSYGYDDGDVSGYAAGLTAGYNNGYDAGETAGYNNGYSEGRNVGLEEGEEIGYSQGYNVGYTDGQAGNTAITPVFNTLSGIFSVIGSVLAIELVPHVPLGIFFLVPLFFSAVGLILWIWRRN